MAWLREQSIEENSVRLFLWGRLDSVISLIL